MQPQVLDIRGGPSLPVSYPTCQASRVYFVHIGPEDSRG